jgi:ubiquinone/menaquinone biosynthesis C-methylase UbiE
VLDVATGIGEPALAAAALVGPSGQVIGTDLSAAMIATAAGHARQQGITNVTFEVADADAGQFPGGRFDAALCRWALMFFADVPAALAGIRCVLAPDAWLAASVVGSPDRYPLVTTVVGVVCAALEMPTRHPHRRGSPVSSACPTRPPCAPR